MKASGVRKVPSNYIVYDLIYTCCASINIVGLHHTV